jgi:hypothetical protein
VQFIAPLFRYTLLCHGDNQRLNVIEDGTKILSQNVGHHSVTQLNIPEDRQKINK